MRSLAAYAIKGRMQAIVVTAVAAILALLLPPLSYFSGATVALVTLRYGLQAGLQLSLMATAVVALLLLLLQMPPQLAGVFMLVLWLPVWAMAMSLRRTVSLARSIGLGLLFGAMLLLGFYLAIDDPAQWWLKQLQLFLQPMLQQVPAQEMPQVEANILELAGLMSGVMAAAMVASLLGCLLLGRWWQATLFNPGGFGVEFRELRLGTPASVLFAGLGVAFLLWQQLQGETAGMLRDLLVLGQVAFALQGLAVTHALVRGSASRRGWLVALYLLLLLFTGQMVLMLAVVGLLDNWFYFRSKFGQGKPTESK